MGSTVSSRSESADVLESVMAFFDLVFPMKLRPLTYAEPECTEKTRTLLPGMLVEAELKKTTRRALVLARGGNGEDPAAQGRFQAKAVKSVLGDGPAVSAPLLELLKWMAGYYMVPEGLVLKVMFGGGLFEKGKRAEAKRPEKSGVENETGGDFSPSALLNGPGELVRSGLNRVRQAQGYRAFLLHAPGGPFEAGFVLEAAKDMRGVIVLCPERSRVMEYQGLMRPVFGRRLCVLHGGLSPAARRSVYAGILAGEADVVLGTRLAVFAPLKKVSLIAITGEEDSNYKNRQDVRYGAREVAVMRAYFEKARVLLASICPSAESRLNALRGKYEYQRYAGPKPVIRIISDSRNRAHGPSTGGNVMDGAVAGALARTLKRGGSALLVAGRHGHSVPLCEDCGHFERCPACGTALILHKAPKEGGTGGSLLCHHCGFGKAALEACARCGGLGLKLLGAGIERLSEEAARLMPGGDVSIKVAPGRGGKTGPLYQPPQPEECGQSAVIYIGTKRISKIRGVFGAARPRVAALVYPESAFFRPDFRARERVFAEINHLADAIAADGQIIIQTKTPELFRAMKGLDYEGFMEAELEERKTLGYPPFSRLARIIIRPRGAKGSTPLPETKTTKALAAPGPADGTQRGQYSTADPRGAWEVLGPAEGMDERGRKCLSVLVKAPTAKVLQKAVESVLESLPQGKVTVDIDPV